MAILGCGKIADAHVEQARATGLAEVVAVCDRERMMAEQLALRYGVPGVYDDLGDLLRNHHVDVVHIATPPGTHVGLAAAAAAAGCHVFVEKPVASTADDADELIRVVTGAGRKLAANLLYNFETPTLELLAAIEKGEIGEVVHVDATYGYDLAGAYGVAVLSDPNHWVHSLPGKLFHNVLDHITCKLALLLPPGRPVVACRTLRRRPAIGQPVVDGLHDELRCELEVSGVTASIMISAHARPVGHLMRVFGTRGSMSLDYLARTAIRVPAQTQPGAVGRLGISMNLARSHRRAARLNIRRFMRSEFHFFQGMRELLQRFYRSILDGSADVIPMEVISSSCHMIDSIVAATRAGTGLQEGR